MPSNRTSKDIDLVQLTQYKVPPNRVAKKPPPEPWELPDFEPLHINNFDNHGTPNLPPTLDRNDPFAIFSQFFTSKIVNKLVEWTNKYAELYLLSDTGKKPWARLWQLICKEELWVYFGVLIYMGFIYKLSIKDYWGFLDATGLEHIVKKYISQIRFKQLDRYFWCTELQLDDDPTPRFMFDRVNKLTEYIQLTCRKLYSSGTYLAVDETIERFMGRAPEIVNIPSKLTPEGFKIQVLANEGYILNWLWHARGDKVGLVNLDKTFTKEEGFLKTQAVVLNFLTQRDAELDKPLYPPGKHVVWLNNLFISIKLLR